MLDFTKLWDKTYLFGPNPTALSRSDYILFGIVAAFTVIGVFSKFLAMRQDAGSPRKFLFNRIFHTFAAAGISLLVWSGARFENIPWLSAHFLALVLLLIWAVWCVFICKYGWSRYREELREWEEKQIRDKYLRAK